MSGEVWRGRARRLVAALGVVAALGGVGAGVWWVYGQTLTIPAERRAALQRQQQELLHAESELKRHAMWARYGVSNQYDDLVRAARALERRSARWSAGQRRALGADPETEAAQARLDALIQDQRAELERFKSRNSVLKNSLRYLPTAGLELRARLEAQPDPTLRARADEVVSYALMFGTFNDPRYEAGLEASLKALEEELRVEAAGAGRKKRPRVGLEEGRLVLLHGQICLREIQGVGVLLKGLRERPVGAGVQELAGLYARRLGAMEARAEGFRQVLYGITGALALALLGLGLWLRRLYATLEQKVEDRTRDLRAAHAQVSALYESNHLVMENVSQGLLTISTRGELSAERSAVMSRWFGAPRPEETLIEWLWRADPGFAEMLALGLEELREAVMPQALLLAQMPGTLQVEGRTWAVSYRAIGEGEPPERLLVIVEEVTEALARRREEARRRQVIELAQRLSQDRGAVVEFLEEADALLVGLRAPSPLAVCKRRLHTLKGNAAIFGLAEFSARVHALEQAVEDEQRAPDGGELEALDGAWAALRAELAPFLGEGRGAAVEISREEHARFLELLSKGASPQALRAQAEGWALEPLEARFGRAAQVLQGLASRLGRAAPEVVIEARGLRADPARWRDLWGASVHVLRNIVDHGLEPPDERVEAGKAPVGRVHLSAQVLSGRCLLRFSDDGRGIDWERVAQKAQRLGLSGGSLEALSEALFVDGLSTRDDVTEVSGRGVGMSAVKAAVEALGGRVKVTSAWGKGTDLIVSVPASLVWAPPSLLEQTATWSPSPGRGSHPGHPLHAVEGGVGGDGA
jgi:HPt (histidine-containing phosphotransfer) domain-containing protein